MILKIIITLALDHQSNGPWPSGAGLRCWWSLLCQMVTLSLLDPGEEGDQREEPDVRDGAWWKHGYFSIDTDIFQYFNNCHGHPGAFGPHFSPGLVHFLIKMDAVEFVAGRERLHFKSPVSPSGMILQSYQICLCVGETMRFPSQSRETTILPRTLSTECQAEWVHWGPHWSAVPAVAIRKPPAW